MSKILNLRLPGSATTAEFNPRSYNQLLEALKNLVLQLNTTYTPQVSQDTQSAMDWFTGGPGDFGIGATDQQQRTFAYGSFLDFTNQVCSAVDTPTAIVWGTTSKAKGIYIDQTDTSKVYFEKGGVYHLHFTAEMHSESSNAKNFYFWPRVNGVDAPGSTMNFSLQSNDERKTLARSAIFQVSDGDYLQAMWAVDNLDADLHGVPADYYPQAPSVTLMVVGLESINYG